MCVWWVGGWVLGWGDGGGSVRKQHDNMTQYDECCSNNTVTKASARQGTLSRCGADVGTIKLLYKGLFSVPSCTLTGDYDK